MNSNYFCMNRIPRKIEIFFNLKIMLFASDVKSFLNQNFSARMIMKHHGIIIKHHYNCDRKRKLNEQKFLNCLTCEHLKSKS